MIEDNEIAEIAYRAFVIPIAREINKGSIDPEKITTTKDLINILNEIGAENDNAINIYVDLTEEKLKEIQLCLDNEFYESSIVLLFTLIEREINRAVRIAMYIKNYSHNTITDLLKHTNFKSKINAILPLLNVCVSEQLKFMAFELIKIRNLIIHNKSKPSIHTDIEDKQSDDEVNTHKSGEFFSQYNLQKAHVFLDKLNVELSNSIPELLSAHLLLEKFTPGDSQK